MSRSFYSLYEAVGNREHYAVAVLAHGMEFKLILFGLPNYRIWTTEKEVEGFTHYCLFPTTVQTLFL